jgi:ABC-2 type transport system permease protein
VIGGAVAAALAEVPAGALPQPAVGWTALLLLALAYLVTAYLIYGAVYLGIGSLCASIREVQSLSLPVTIVQAMVLLGVMGALGRPEGAWAAVMSWFPLSSPYMMAARAAIEPGIARHVAALLWQLVFAAVVIWFSARLFRYGVLASAPVSPWRLLRRQKSSLS